MKNKELKTLKKKEIKDLKIKQKYDNANEED